MTDVHASHTADHPHDHPHDHTHSHDEEHDLHLHHESWGGRIAAALHVPGYAHTHERPAASNALYANDLGIRTLKLAFMVLALTTIIQIAIYLGSGSIALLADTVHNLGDALNSLPLLFALMLSRRAANKRYTYGYGRAENLAGLLIVVSIVFSAAYIFWESLQKILNPEPLTNLAWIAAAAVIGFFGNETVALMQIRVGRQIGSEAMIADGKHARTDGFTSLAVLIAVAGTWLGFPIVDPIIGVVIGIIIVFIAREATIAMWHRLMDAVDPALIQKAELVLESHDEVKQVVRLQMRWIGHRLNANVIIALDEDLPLATSEQIADHIRHHLLHDISHLDDVAISTVPWNSSTLNTNTETAHHRLA